MTKPFQQHKNHIETRKKSAPSVEFGWRLFFHTQH